MLLTLDFGGSGFPRSKMIDAIPSSGGVNDIGISWGKKKNDTGIS